MFDRKTYKSRGKTAFKANYWWCVLAALIFTFCSTFYMSYSTRNTAIPNEYTYSSSVNADTSPSSVKGSLSFSLGLVNILVLNVIAVGGCRFFVNNESGKAGMHDFIDSFTKESYGQTVLTMFLRALFTALWTCLFIIPGIIKSYEYCLIPYILAENPGLDRKTAFIRSKYLMKGHKWDMFVLDLSFIGWYLLSALTFGILAVFYVSPYLCATKAEAYTALCEMKDSAPAEA